MRSRVFCLVAVLMLGSATFALGWQQHETANEGIGKTIEQFTDAWNKHDAHAFAAIFTQDADFTNVAGMHAKGRADIEAFHSPTFASIFKDSHLSATVRSNRMLTPEIAAVDVDWQMTGVKGPDGAARPDRHGLADLIMTKRSGGKWLVEVMHNTDLTNMQARSSAK
jgi:uncharacterized protein (TIGR02246 family)